VQHVPMPDDSDPAQEGSGEVADYWDNYAGAYDDQPDHGLGESATREAWRALLQAWLPEQPGTVADLACGTGSLTALVAGLGHQVVGVDLAPNMVSRARAKTAQYGDRVAITLGDITAPPLEPGSVEVVLARHVLWTLPNPNAALARWRSLLRPAGRFLLVEGRWWSVGDEDYADHSRMPWAPGVRAVDLVAAVMPLVRRVEVVPLTDPVLWGREVTDERYLLVGHL
jgi:SAM-dependent methyltransferase